MNRRTAFAVSLVVLAASFASPARAQAPGVSEVLRDRYGHVWFTPATRVLREDGSLKGRYAGGVKEGASRDPDEPAGVGSGVRYWQSRFRETYDSARSLGLQDGDRPDSRAHCVLDEMTTSSGPLLIGDPPDEFEDWAAQTAALVETRVVALTPGFDRGSDPKLLVSLAVERHFYPPKEPFAQRLHIIMPVGEFVAGDTVFCARQTWGGYRPRLDDRLVVAAFDRPVDADDSLLPVRNPNRVFFVGDDGALIRLNRGYEKDRRLTRSFVRLRTPNGDVVKWLTGGFPTTLDDLVDQMRRLWDSGALNGPTFSDLLREERRKAHQDRKSEGGR